MTDAEMIKLLRNSPFTFNDIVADRIEQLVEDNKSLTGAQESLVETLRESGCKRKEAEAKLAKAVKALREMMEDAEYPDAVWEKGDAVLEELEKLE